MTPTHTCGPGARMSPACDISSAGGVYPCGRCDRCDHAHGETGERWRVAAPAPAPPTQPRTGHRLQEELLSGSQAEARSGSLISYPLGLELKKGSWFWGIFSTS